MTIPLDTDELDITKKICAIMDGLSPYKRVLIFRSVWILTGCEEIAPLIDEELVFRNKEMEVERQLKLKEERRAIRDALRERRTKEQKP